MQFRRLPERPRRLHLDDTYATTIIGVPDRGYAWIMARSRTLPEKRYQELVGLLFQTGQDNQQAPSRPATLSAPATTSGTNNAV